MIEPSSGRHANVPLVQADRRDHAGVVRGPEGRRPLERRVQLKNPHGVAIDATGNVYVADTSNGRVQKFH